jgi:hypothetical protein
MLFAVLCGIVLHRAPVDAGRAQASWNPSGTSLSRFYLEGAGRSALRNDHSHIVGARPSFMKLAPVLGLPPCAHAACARRSSPPASCVAVMSGAIFTELGLPKPDVNLGVGSGTHTQSDRAESWSRWKSGFRRLEPI